jgi:hypothetical protein
LPTSRLPISVPNVIHNLPRLSGDKSCKIFSQVARELVRCLAMGFLLESSVQLADSQVPYLSTPTSALQNAKTRHVTVTAGWPKLRFLSATTYSVLRYSLRLTQIRWYVEWSGVPGDIQCLDPIT